MRLIKKNSRESDVKQSCVLGRLGSVCRVGRGEKRKAETSRARAREKRAARGHITGSLPKRRTLAFGPVSLSSRQFRCGCHDKAQGVRQFRSVEEGGGCETCDLTLSECDDTTAEAGEVTRQVPWHPLRKGT